jgi:hypothetical protein
MQAVFIDRLAGYLAFLIDSDLARVFSDSFEARLPMGCVIDSAGF